MAEVIIPMDFRGVLSNRPSDAIQSDKAFFVQDCSNIEGFSKEGVLRTRKTIGQANVNVTMPIDGSLSGGVEDGKRVNAMASVPMDDGSVWLIVVVGNVIKFLELAPPTLKISTDTLADGVAGSSYSDTVAATGGTPGYTFSLFDGSLPPGLTLAADGTISGTIDTDASGYYHFIVKVADSGTDEYYQEAFKALMIYVAPVG